jgi:plasmid stability protein
MYEYMGNITTRRDFYVYLYMHPKTGIPVYVGKGWGRRWRQHLYGSTNSRLSKSIAKHGEHPVVKIRTHLTDDEAKAAEIALITAIGRADQGRGPLFNFTDGGDGSNGFKHSEEICVWLRIRPTSEGARAKMRAAHLGKKLSAETRAKISAGGAGIKKPRTPEHQAKITAASVGRKASAETRAILSAMRLGKPMPPGTGAKIAAAQIGNTRGLGTKHSAESIEITRQKNLGQKRSDETKAKLRAAWEQRKARGVTGRGHKYLRFR